MHHVFIWSGPNEPIRSESLKRVEPELRVLQVSVGLLRGAQRDEWGCSGYRDRGGVLPGAVPAAPIWRLQEAAAHGVVWHAAGLVPVFPHRLYLTSGRQHGQYRSPSLTFMRRHKNLSCECFMLSLQTIYKQCKIDHEEHVSVPTASPLPSNHTAANTSVTPTKRLVYNMCVMAAFSWTDVTHLFSVLDYYCIFLSLKIVFHLSFFTCFYIRKMLQWENDGIRLLVVYPTQKWTHESIFRAVYSNSFSSLVQLWCNLTQQQTKALKALKHAGLVQVCG